MYERDYIQNRNIYNGFTVFYVRETNNCDEIESIFKKELKIRELLRPICLYNKNRTEIFIINNIWTKEKIINLIDTIIDNNPLIEIAKFHERTRYGIRVK